jgi:hypothetical protein
MLSSHLRNATNPELAQLLGSSSLGSELGLLWAPNERPGRFEVDARGWRAYGPA